VKKPLDDLTGTETLVVLTTSVTRATNSFASLIAGATTQKILHVTVEFPARDRLLGTTEGSHGDYILFAVKADATSMRCAEMIMGSTFLWILTNCWDFS
jgi:hypothetical protein